MTAIEETHPYNGSELTPEGTCLLIVGTAPPQRFAQPKKLGPDDIDFYYGSRDNQLWRVIFPKLYPNFLRPDEVLSVDALRHFLKNQGIWLCDICEKYTRTRSDASDKNLNPSKFTDLHRIFKERPTINTIIFTGGLAEKWSGEQMEKQGLIPAGQFWRDMRQQHMPRQRRFIINVDGAQREIQCNTLPSPSYANARVYREDRKIEIYRKIVVERCPSM